MLLKTIILICSINTPAEDCSEATALDVAVVSEQRDAAICGAFGQAGAQAKIAASAIAPVPGKTYLKTKCVRTGEPG